MAKLYVSNKDESARLFRSDLLEPFSHVHWSVPILLYVPVVAFFLHRASQTPEINAVNGVLLFVGGLFFWTLTEYLLHRFVFHYEPTSNWGKRLHFLMHGVHHDYPNDSKRLVMPPVVSIPLAALFYGVFYVVIGPVFTPPFFAGFIAGYICYDTIHYATHHAPMKSRMAQWMKHHHVRHHYKDDKKGYGVSTPLWDFVFRTMEDVPDEKRAEA